MCKCVHTRVSVGRQNRKGPRERMKRCEGEAARDKPHNGTCMASALTPRLLGPSWPLLTCTRIQHADHTTLHCYPDHSGWSSLPLSPGRSRLYNWKSSPCLSAPYRVPRQPRWLWTPLTTGPRSSFISPQTCLLTSDGLVRWFHWALLTPNNLRKPALIC